MGRVLRPMMHAEVLPQEQQACLRQLGPAATALGFHLIGGTAVAIQLGHRQSVDFDWCTQQFPVEPVNLSATLAGRGVPLAPTSLAHGTVHGYVAGVKVSFLLPSIRSFGSRASAGFALLFRPRRSRADAHNAQTGQLGSGQG